MPKWWAPVPPAFPSQWIAVTEDPETRLTLPQEALASREAVKTNYPRMWKNSVIAVTQRLL
jgi:hypothetical protein